MKATLRFYGTLGDFLPAARRGVAFDCDIGERRSVKDLVESLGVPHCEVFLVLVDGASAAFERVVLGGERIAVFPHFCDMEFEGVTAGEPLPRDGRFVLDGHLGRLAAYLRALGFDTSHDRDADDASIAERGAAEDRVVLTRDVGLLKRGIVRHGYFVRATAPRDQTIEIVRRFRIAERAAPFTRCLRCNGLLADPSAERLAEAPPRIRAQFDVFRECPACRRLYWPGTHHARLVEVISEVLRHAALAHPPM